MEEEFNPYAAPVSGTLLDDLDAAQIRAAYLPTESNVKAVGAVYIGGALVLLFVQVLLVWVANQAYGGFYLPWAVIYLILPLSAGIGLIGMRAWAGRLAMLLAVIAMVVNLVQLPRGLVELVLHASLLRFLLGRKARRVLASDYADIIRATSNLQAPMARWIWWVGALGGLIFLTGVLIVA